MIEVQPSLSMEGVRHIVLSQWDKYAEDGLSKADFNPKQMGNEAWLDIISDGEVIGVCKVTSLQLHTVCIHPYVAYPHRHKFKSALRQVLSTLFNQYPIHKVVAMVGVQHEYVIRTAMRLGARTEGLITRSYLKDGYLWDQVILGLEKGELK